MRIFFDNAATTPIDDRVIEVMVDALRHTNGNPSSIHQEGDLIKAQIRDDASVSASAMNQKLAEKGIYLSHLTKKKLSLESQFLELVKNTN